MCARARVCVCVCVCVHECVYECVYVCTHICVHIRVDRVYICMYVCVHMYLEISIRPKGSDTNFKISKNICYSPNFIITCNVITSL